MSTVNERRQAQDAGQLAMVRKNVIWHGGPQIRQRVKCFVLAGQKQGGGGAGSFPGDHIDPRIADHDRLTWLMAETAQRGKQRLRVRFVPDDVIAAHDAVESIGETNSWQRRRDDMPR